MSKRVRRTALGLAALALLASLFMALQGFLDPPEAALAACQVEYSCGDYMVWTFPSTCCCDAGRILECVCRFCTKINLDCTVTEYRECPWCYCSGRSCQCFP